MKQFEEQHHYCISRHWHLFLRLFLRRDNWQTIERAHGQTGGVALLPVAAAPLLKTIHTPPI